MRVIKLVLFIFFSLIVALSLTGCKEFLDQFPNKVDVTFDPNGGRWKDGGTDNVTQNGTEGEEFKLPYRPYKVYDAKYDKSTDKTVIRQYKFLGWTLQGSSTLIYNKYDTYGAFPEEDKVYAAKWGSQEKITESGNTESNYQ
ncbi:MAG: hypothetical protein PUH08_00095 [Treponema sp.]|nr:hypothetical protein [Treponema sp.]MDY4673438.1 hypothetical protein [Treponema sp.]